METMHNMNSNGFENDIKSYFVTNGILWELHSLDATDSFVVVVEAGSVFRSVPIFLGLPLFPPSFIVLFRVSKDHT